MQTDGNGNRLLFFVFSGIYCVSIIFSFIRVYVYKDYPIYYSQEDIPSLSGQFSIILGKILP